MKMLRHGDVQLIKIETLPNDVKKIDGRILAYGEITGHKHQVDVGELFETKDGKLFLRTDRLATITHEEHGAKPIEPGTYAVVIKRHYVSATGGWANVAD